MGGRRCRSGRDLGAIARGLARAERLARGTAALDEARRAERAATTAVSLIAIIRDDVPSDEIDATVRAARAAIARTRELVTAITEDDLGVELDEAAMHAGRVRDLLVNHRSPLEE